MVIQGQFAAAGGKAQQWQRRRANWLLSMADAYNIGE